MTQEEKAKAYDEAIEKAKNTIEVNQTIPDIVECVKSLFPELKECESEDEKIRKEIIDFIYDKTDTYELREKSNFWLAWLEKQDELIVELQKAYTEIGRLVKENHYLKEKLCGNQDN